MDENDFVRKAKRLHRRQALTIRFKPTGFAGLTRLYSLLEHDPRIRLSSESDRVIMMAVISSGNWAHSRNRSYVVYGISMADDESLDEIGKDVESVEASDHPAKGIMTG